MNDTFEELGMPKEYQRLKNSIKWGLIMLLFMMCASWTADCSMSIALFNDTRALMIPIVLDYSLQINFIMDIIFMLLLRFVNLTLLQLVYKMHF